MNTVFSFRLKPPHEVAGGKGGSGEGRKKTTSHSKRLSQKTFIIPDNQVSDSNYVRSLTFFALQCPCIIRIFCEAVLTKYFNCRAW